MRLLGEEASMGGQGRDTVAVVVYRDRGSWASDVLPERITDDLDALIRVLRQQPADNGAIALVNVADEFFVALRVSCGEVRMMLSDVSAAVAWDLARQVTDRLGIDAPDDEEAEDIWPAGDIGIFTDLGLNEIELSMLLDDLDAYADEMLLSVAGRLGFADVYDRALESAIQ
jgi:putative tRNA adenosine deaminase-associated protein